MRNILGQALKIICGGILQKDRLAYIQEYRKVPSGFQILYLRSFRLPYC